MSLIILPKELSPVHIRKYRDRQIELPCAGHVGVGGYFRLECVKDDGRSFWLSDWFHNNVTNAGLDMIATNISRYYCCQVGSGTAVPNNSDTTLQTFVAGTSSHSSQGSSYQNSSAPFYAENYFRFDFAINQVIGNISEIGVGPSASSGSTLFSRELIRDASGNPTTISIPTNSQVRVHYKLRNYVPSTDVLGSVNGVLYGVSGSRNFTRRASGFSSGYSASATWLPTNPVGVANNWGAMCCDFGQQGGAPGYKAYSGSIGLISSEPSGSAISGSVSGNSYSPGSFSRSATISFSHTTGALNAKSFQICGRSSGQSDPTGVFCPFQVEFDSAIAKAANDTLNIGIQYTWGRYP